MNYSYFRLGFLFASAALLPLASAQTKKPVETVGGDEPVQLSAFVVDTSKDNGYAASNAISATKINMAVKDLPFGITILTDDFIKDRSATTVQEAMAFTASYNNDNGNIRALKGGGQRQRNGFGEYFGRHSLSSIDRVEVLKGPASVIYGISYPGGYVNPITKRPRPRDSMEFSTQIGWENNYRLMADVNEVFNPKVSARVNSEFRHVRSATEFDDTKNFVNHAVIQFRPTKTLEILWDTEVLRSEGPEVDDWSIKTDNDIPLRELFGVPAGYSYNGRDAYAGDDNVFNMLVVNQRWSEGFTTEFVINQNWRANRRYNQNKFVTSILNLPGVTPVRRGVRLGWQKITDDTKRWDFQLKNLFKFKLAGSDQQLLVQLQRTEGSGGRTTSLNALLPNGTTDFYYFPLQGVTNWDAIDRSKPANLNYQVNLPDLNRYQRLGLQYTVLHHAEFKFGDSKLHTIAGGVYYDYDGVTKFFNGAAATVNQQHRTLPTGGFAIQPNEIVSVYGLYAKSFNPENRNDGFNRPLPATEGDSYEGGVKLDTPSKKLSGTFSYFSSKEKNRRVTNPEAPNSNSFGVNPALPISATNPVAPNSPKGASVAVGEFTTKGLDTEAIYTPVENWQLVLSYLYSDALVSYDPVATNMNRRDAGHAFHTGALWTKYTFMRGPLAGLGVGGGWRVTSTRLRFYRIVSGASVAYETPGERRVDLYGSYAKKMFGHEVFFQANIENLLKQNIYVGDYPGTVIPYAYATPVRWNFTVGLRF